MKHFWFWRRRKNKIQETEMIKEVIIALVVLAYVFPFAYIIIADIADVFKRLSGAFSKRLKPALVLVTRTFTRQIHIFIYPTSRIVSLKPEILLFPVFFSVSVLSAISPYVLPYLSPYSRYFLPAVNHGLGSPGPQRC